jgi:hypothetical protein
MDTKAGEAKEGIASTGAWPRADTPGSDLNNEDQTLLNIDTD